MIVDATLKKNYPKLAKWVKNELPKVKKKGKVWKAFLKYSELSDSKATTAVKEGSKPTLKYKSMGNTANGEFIGSKFPDTIFLAKEICEKHKTDHAKAAMQKLVESTILHEMVHWGDWKDGKDQPGEEGKKFEKAAYGADVDRYW